MLRPNAKTRALQTGAAGLASVAAGVVGQLIPGPEEIGTIPFAATRAARLVAPGIAAAGVGAAEMLVDPDVEWNFGELAKTAGIETALEAVPDAVFSGGRFLFKGVPAERIVPGANELSETLGRQGKRLGIKRGKNAWFGGRKPEQLRILPAQLSDSQRVDLIQGIGEGALIGSDPIQIYKGKGLRAAGKLVDDLPKTLVKGASKSLDETGLLLFDAIEGPKGVRAAFRSTERELYAALDEVVGSRPVRKTVTDTVPSRILSETGEPLTKDVTRTVMREEGGARPVLQQVKAKGREILARADKAGRIGFTETSLADVDRLVNNVDDVVNFSTAHDIRSGMLDAIRKAESKLAPDPKAAAALKQLLPLMDQSMQTAARGLSPKALAMWRTADRYHKHGMKTFYNKLLNQLVHKLPDNPELVGKMIFKKGGVNNIQRVKEVASPKLFQEIKAAWIESIIKTKADPTDVMGGGQAIGTRVLEQFNSLGQKTLDTAFTAAEQKIVRDNARILAFVQAQTGKHAGALRFVQGSALVTLAAAPFIPDQYGTAKASTVATAAGILLGPAVLARALTRPWFQNALLTGIKSPPLSQQAIANTARFGREILKIRKEVNSERRQRQLIEQGVKPLTVSEFRGMGP